MYIIRRIGILTLTSSFLILAGCTPSFRPSSMTVINSNGLDLDGEEIVIDPDRGIIGDRRFGYLRVRLGTGTDGARSVQAFPASTTRFRITVSASDLSQSMAAFINRTPSAASEAVRIAVPVGVNRTLTVEALNGAGRTVASQTISGLTVTAGQFTPVTASLINRVGAIDGTVVDGETGLPVAGVTVTTSNVSALSSTTGAYHLEDVPVGTAELRMSRNYYYDATQSVAVISGNSATGGETQLLAKHWNEQISGTSSKLTCVEAISNSVAFVGGENGTLLKTADGGETWSRIQTGTTYGISGIDFIDSLVGFYITNNYTTSAGGIYRTSDGGQTWSRLISNTEGYVIAAFSASEFYWGSGAGYVTGNAGTTNTYYNYTYSFRGLSAVSRSILFSNDSYGYLYKTTSGMQTWSSLPYPPVNVYTDAGAAIAAASANEVAVAGYKNVNSIYRPAVAESIDGGASWTTVYEGPEAATSKGFTAVGRVGTGWCAVGLDGVIAMRPPNRSEWQAYSIQPADPRIYDLRAVSFAGASAGWAVGDSGKILKY